MTFTFTIEQIKEIYNAGIRRGHEEATAFEWGSFSFPGGKKYDECIDAMHDIVNEGIKWGEEGYTEYNTVEEWFKGE